MEELKITKDNYKGYCELYQNFRCTTVKEIKKAAAVTFVSFLVGGSVGLAGAILKVPAFVFYTYTFAIMPTIMLAPGFIVQRKNVKKRYEKVAEKYSYIDLNIKKEELEKALEEARILKDRVLGVLDIKGYESYLKAEEIKEDMIEENKFSPIEIKPTISDKEMEKVKVKVKEFVRK